MAETYTVAASGVFEDAAGIRRSFIEGTVIPMTTAYAFGLPDAEAPTVDTTVFNTGQDAYVDAGDAVNAAALAAHAISGLNAQRLSEARTATAAPGGTTGVISANVDTV